MPGGGISDLDKNRALADWLEWQLRQVRGRIRELEVKEQQEQRRRVQAHAALRWKIQPQRSSSVALVHRGTVPCIRSRADSSTVRRR
ncbi:hypothetical protein [Streptomyces sp. NBC_00062]|uniref:hypothetical protein n=1 Tax=Streptomyces sp. NBC_00062 TaxID=2975637 RepID=UPI002254A3F0|nr:hypothetical protein [Streptomyces sp. NBC_00062]MCX5434517.1 hypothetical protein [Streptomyces sp. NBC_00062]